MSQNSTNAASDTQSDTFELFQTATASCVRALGHAPTHAISFGRLWQSGPEQTEFPNVADESTLRGLADLEAAHLRFKAAQPAPSFTVPAQREFFEFLEQARRAALLGQRFAGAGDNIWHFWQQTPVIDFKWLHEDDPPALLLNAALSDVRAVWMGKAATPSAWQKQITELQNILNDEVAFNLAVTNFIQSLWQKETPRVTPPQPEKPKAHSSDQDETSNDDQGAALESASQSESAVPPPPATFPQETTESAFRSAEQDQEGVMLHAPPAQASDKLRALSRYQVFTTHYDEVVFAQNLADTAERQKLRRELETHLQPFERLVHRLALQLQAQLQSFQPVGWQRGLDDGLLDLKRLPAVYSHRHGKHPLIYKQPQLGLTRDAVVTLLLDNSGSMRGRPILITALCADILARTLERCGVKTEILGFTTRAWKGGNAAKEWQTLGKPPHPGRLNELRHIIYKSADQNWQQSRLNLSVMLKEGLLRENIDGEALLWAASRLQRRSEKRKILMVISDGAPVDDATLSANTPDYLERHLHDTIAWLTQDKTLELVAIGIGHDVTRYYPHATMIRNAETLAETMLAELKRLLKQAKTA